MSKNRLLGSLINFLSVDGSGNIVLTGSLLGPGGATYATQSFVTTQVAALVASAPATLDTLNELATALGNDPNFATTVSNSIGNRVPYTGATGSLDLGAHNLTATYLRSTGTGAGLLRMYADFAQNYIESYAPNLSSYSKLVFLGGGFSFRPTLATTHFDIDSSGNVGVGVAASGSFKFDVSGTGRFTGALTGTSATFSGSVTANTSLITPFLSINSSGGQLGSIRSTNANGGYITWESSASTIADIGTLQQVFGSGGSDTFGINARGARSLHLGTNNTSRFVISSTGAATFSSSVTAGTGFTTADGGFTAFTSGGNSSYSTRMSTAYNFPFVDSYFDSLAAVSYEGRISFRTSSNAGALGTRMTILNSGNVGIGTDSPNSGLHINSGATRGMRVDVNSGVQAISISPNGIFGIDEPGVGNGRFIINTNGRVGIGTSSPGAPLHIIRALGADCFAIGETGSNQRFRIGQEASYTGNYINSTNIDLKLITYADGGSGGTMIFYTSSNSTPAERMRITTTGKIITRANDSDYSLTMYNSASNCYGMYLNYSAFSPNSTNYEFAYFADSTNSKFIVWSNGSVINRTGSYGTISDVKFKENIVDATPKLGDIAKLKVRNFNLKGENTKQIGFIAQEFEEVFPNMVDVSTERGADGETYKSIKTSVLVPMLVKAVQELKAELDLLKNK